MANPADRPDSIGARGKYNDVRHEVIVTAVRKGNYRSTAARLADLSPTQLFKWLEEGAIASDEEIPYDDPRGRYRKLFEDVENAEAEFEAEMVAKVKDAAQNPKNWTAAMTLLERTRPERFGRRDTTVVEGGERPIQTATLHILTTPEALSAANDMLKALTSPQRPVVVEGRGEIPALPAPSLEDLDADEPGS